jgi:2-C-methyl-D-erythritol 4-phosphate cytidylyltransferase
MDKNLALILAGGTSSRMKGILPKQFTKIAGKTILQHTVNTFEEHPLIHSIFLVAPKEYINKTKNLVRDSSWVKVKRIIAGGASRQESSYLGINGAELMDFENVLIHDAARPFISYQQVNSLLDELKTYQAVTLAISASDTIVRVDGIGVVTEFIDRKGLQFVQTPQGFKLSLIKKAHDMARENNMDNTTDDCSLVFKFKLAPVSVIQGSPLNIKITHPEDLQLARRIFEIKQMKRE